ncbi:hypothetical protein GCM10022245_38670 [Streptomyces mayteni]
MVVPQAGGRIRRYGLGARRESRAGDTKHTPPNDSRTMKIARSRALDSGNAQLPQVTRESGSSGQADTRGAKETMVTSDARVKSPWGDPP